MSSAGKISIDLSELETGFFIDTVLLPAGDVVATLFISINLLLIKTSGSNQKPCPLPLVEPISCHASHPQSSCSQRTRHMVPTDLCQLSAASGSPETRDPKKLPAQTDPQMSTPPKFDNSELSP